MPVYGRVILRDTPSVRAGVPCHYLDFTGYLSATSFGRTRKYRWSAQDEVAGGRHSARLVTECTHNFEAIVILHQDMELVDADSSELHSRARRWSSSATHPALTVEILVTNPSKVRDDLEQHVYNRHGLSRSHPGRRSDE